MSLTIKIVTTANIARQFHLSNDVTAKATLDRLIGWSAIFTSPSLVISSDIHTEVFSPKRLAIIELNSESGQSDLISTSDMRITAIDPDQQFFAYDLEVNNEQRFKVDFYFVGGFVLRSEVLFLDQDASIADRTRRIAQVFEQQVIFYKTPHAGIGMLNPNAMTRAVITPRSEVLPADAIIVDAY